MTRTQLRADLALVPGYHSPQMDVEVRLNTNESPLPPPPGFAEAFAAEVAALAWNRYPDRSATLLREAIAAHHGVSPDRVFAANGSNEVLQSVLLAYGGARRSALVFEPTYAMHSHIARVTGTAVITAEREADFSIDPTALQHLAGQHQPTVTFLCSPNNPTGTVDPVDNALAALAAVEGHGGLVVVDEAYGQFAPQSAIDMVSDARALVVTRTFSKTWAMAAARLGYLVGPTWLVAELEKVALPYHLSATSQLAGRIALRFESAMNERVALVVGERQRLAGSLDDLDLDVFPSHANFILVRPRGRSGDEVWNDLVDRSVLVRNCSSWPRLQNCLRITVGTPDDNVRLLAALKEIV